MKKSVPMQKDFRPRTLIAALFACLVGALFSPALLAVFDPVNDDTDIFLVNPNIESQRANVLLYVDNTANWNTAFDNEKSALVSVVQNLTDQFNLGLMLFPETGGDNDSVDGGYVRFGIRQMTGDNKPVLANIVNGFHKLNDAGNNNTLSEGMIEVFRYFSGGHSRASHGKVKTDFAGNNIFKACSSCAVTEHPATAAGLGDYPLPASPTSSSSYTTPIAHACQKNFLIYISNGAANENANSLTEAENELDSLGYDTNDVINLTPDGQEGSWMDEFAKYLANADINGADPGEPTVYTYVVEVDPGVTGQGPAMTALMQSVAANGKGKYFAVSSGNNGQAIVNALNQIFQDIQAVNSVFASTTLPVSVNVRGTNLNQVYIGVFRPDEKKSPRWFGNLKLYVLGFNEATSKLFLADATGSPAENPETGFINPTASSFWTEDTEPDFWAFRTSEQNGAGGASDLPDGDLVEKGGIAEMLRNVYAGSQATRNLYTCTTGTTVCSTGSQLSDTPFDVGLQDDGITPKNDGITAANMGLGTQSVSTLTGFAAQTITSLTDTKQVTSLSAPGAAGSVAITSLTGTPNNAKTVDVSLKTAVSKPITALSNGAVIKSIAALARAAGASKLPVTATVNGHGYSTGQLVHIAGVSAAEYNGSFTITVTDSNNFTYNTASTPTANPTITSATVTTTSSIVTATATAHSFNSGDSVTIAGVVPTSYNSAYNITKINNDSFSFTTAAALAPITDISSATATGPSTTATATFSANHGFANGNQVIISGATPAGYNGTFTITVGADLTKFTYPVTSALATATQADPVTPVPITASQGTLVTANAPLHGFIGTPTVTISGAAPSGYNGTVTITVGADPNSFTYTKLQELGGPVVPNPAIFATPSTSFGTTAIAVATNHGFKDGDSVIIAGVTDAADGNQPETDYNGPHTITRVDADTFTFPAPWPTNPLPPFGLSPAPAGTITARLDTATVTAIATVPGHGYNDNDSIKIEGAVDAVGVDTDDYNGTFTIDVIDNNTFRYPLLLVTPQGDASGAMTAKIRTTTARARAVTHGFSTDDAVAIDGATPVAFRGTWTITVVDADNFTYDLTENGQTAQGDAAGTIVATSGSGSDGALADIVNWVRGADNFEDENGDGDGTDIRSTVHGDVLHSRPAVVNYNRHGNDDDVYIFYGANDGIFRAVKGGFAQSDVTEPDPGQEAWGFIPVEFFSSLERLRDNEPIISSSNKKPYFADGTIGVYVDDAGGEGELIAADGDKVWLYISMHRGGRFIYALDVSDPSDPRFLWKKSNNDPGWTELGQNWSAPRVTRLRVDIDGAGADDEDEDIVLVFGAGYDPLVEDVPPEDITAVTEAGVEVDAAEYERSMGRGIFVVNAANGNIIWQAGPGRQPGDTGTHPYVEVADMDYAIPSDVVVITDRAGSIGNRAYVGDTGGNMWRVDMADGDVNNWTVTKVASIADTGTIPGGLRKFLFPPDVVYSDDGYDAILIGSGDREHPFDDVVTNRFYMFKDTGTSTEAEIDTTIDDTSGTTTDNTKTPTLDESDLFDATSNCIQDASACSGLADEADQTTATSALSTKDGWYITLGVGEKVVGNAVTLNNVTFFNTNQPSDASPTSCDSDLGTARQYKVKFDDATAIADQNIDGSLDALDRSEVHPGGGYLPSPVPVTVEIDGEIHEGVISGVSVDVPPGSLLNARLRKFWFKEME